MKLIALLALAIAPAFAEPDPTMQGLSAAEVLLENLDAGSLQLGLNADSIRTDVELRLREGGFGVLSPGYDASHAFFDVSIATTPNSRATMVQVQLGEAATTKRLPSVSTLAITWIASTVLANPTADTIRTTVKDCVDHFLNDWLAINPARAQRAPSVEVTPAVRHE